MDHKQVINQRQLSWLVASIVTSGGIMSLQNILFRVNEMDAWFSYLLPVFYIFLVATFFATLSRMFPGKHIFEISMLLLGRIGGSIATLIILFHFWMIVIRDISNTSRFTSTILLNNTPIEILILLACLLLVYYGKSSLEIIARVNDVFYPLFVISILLMPLLLSNEIFFRLITPVLTCSPMNLFNGGLLALGGAGDVFFIGAFMHTIVNSRQIHSSIRHGMMLGILLLTLVTVLEVFVLGPKMPGNFLYPPYNLVQMIHVTDFLDRLDIIILTIWFPTVACKIVAIYMGLLIGLSSLMKESDHTLLNRPVALFIVVTSLLSFNSSTELFAFSNFSSPVIVLAYQPLIMGVLYFIARRKKGSHTIALSCNGPKMQQAGLSGKNSHGAWVRYGNMIVVSALLLLILGLSISRYIPLIGAICGGGYFLCLMLTTLTTHKEVTTNYKN